MSKKSGSVTYELEINRWVEWFRGVNNPEVQWKVAERQLNMLMAEKRIVYWEAVYDQRRGPRVILHAANHRELEQLEGHLAKVFPKVPNAAPEPEEREEYRNQRDEAFKMLAELIGEAKVINQKAAEKGSMPPQTVAVKSLLDKIMRRK